MKEPLIIVSDDDPTSREFCCDTLRSSGYSVEPAESASHALQRIRQRGVALVLAEVHLAGLSGLELLETIKAEHPATDVILMSAHGSVETAVRGLKRGAADYLRKPFAAEELQASVHSALARRRLYHENEQLGAALRLLEISRSFAAADEPGRVLELALGALVHASQAMAGLCLFTGPGQRFMGLLNQKALPPEYARSLRDALVGHQLKRLQSLQEVEIWSRIRLRRALGDHLYGELGEAAVIPLRERRELKGVFVLFRGMTGRFTRNDLENTRFLGSQVELSLEAAQRFQEAKKLAFVDPLTDLYNARYLELALERRVADAEKSGSPLSVLLMDIDRFRQINDAHGHLTGGRVLIEIARILLGNLREEDTVVRYGGDEFTIVLPGTGSAQAREVAERIRAAVKEHVFLSREGKTIRLTASIGVATYPDDARSREALIEQADRAMYQGKQAQRDIVYVARTH